MWAAVGRLNPCFYHFQDAKILFLFVTEDPMSKTHKSTGLYKPEFSRVVFYLSLKMKLFPSPLNLNTRTLLPSGDSGVGSRQCVNACLKKAFSNGHKLYDLNQFLSIQRGTSLCFLLLSLLLNLCSNYPGAMWIRLLPRVLHL